LHLFVQRRSDTDTRLELWSLEQAALKAELDIAGSPALVALDSAGTRIAVADFDQAVRVWDFQSGEMLVQLDLPLQPSVVELAAGGQVLGVIYGESGMSMWNLDRPELPLIEERGPGRWQLAMSPSGTSIAAGRPRSGYQIYRASDGRQLGPTLGAGGSDPGLLLFSGDERVLLTGGPSGATRFWRVPPDVVPVEAPGQTATHALWAPSGDAVVTATPDASGIVIGDRGGHVHRLPGDVSAEELAAAVEDVSFLGHEAPIRLLTVSNDGRLAASAAADDTVRAWDLGDGRPLPFVANVTGGMIRALEFSPDASMVAVIGGTQVLILDALTGEIVVEVQPGDIHTSVAFADADHVYIGSESGALSVIARDTTGAWNIQQLWQGSAPIRWLRASPRGQFLVLVDQDNLAQQFSLVEGRVGELSITLPDTVEDIAFDPAGSRVFFRTARWVQRASSSANGLIWLDAVFGPRAVQGAGIVVAAGSGNDVHVPVAHAGSVMLRRMQFFASEGPGLFGNKDELLQDWRTRLGLAAPAAEVQEETVATDAEAPPG
jgi:WD40 repeat protein